MQHSCVGVDNGLLVFGGMYRESGWPWNYEVFRLRQNQWREVGRLAHEVWIIFKTCFKFL